MPYNFSLIKPFLVPVAYLVVLNSCLRKLFYLVLDKCVNQIGKSNQVRIQNPIKYFRKSILWKYLTEFSRSIFSQNALLDMFDKVLDTSFQTVN